MHIHYDRWCLQMHSNAWGYPHYEAEPWFCEPWLTPYDPYMPNDPENWTDATWHVYPWWLRGDFTDSYPFLYPYFPVSSFDAAWIDSWSMQPYHHTWWG